MQHFLPLCWNKFITCCNIHLINCLLLLAWVGSDNLSILIREADDLMNELPNQNNEETFVSLIDVYLNQLI